MATRRTLELLKHFITPTWESQRNLFLIRVSLTRSLQFTQARFLPPSNMLDADIRDNVIGEGCVIQKAKIYHSSLGLRSWVADGAHVEDTLLMGADYYEASAFLISFKLLRTCNT